MSVVGKKRESCNQSKWKHTVFGYIRRHEVDGYIYVPEVIKNMCVDFYWLDEKFVRVSDSSVLHLDEGGRLIHNFSPSWVAFLFFRRNRNHYANRATGSVWISADSQCISKCKWTLQIIRGDELSIGITDGHIVFHIWIRKGTLRTIREDNRSGDFQYKELCHGLDSLDEVIMELDVENHTLNFSVRAPPRFTRHVEMRDLPIAKYHLYAVLGTGNGLRLKDFSIEHRTCSDNPVIPRDVHFSCTHWIIRISLAVLWVAADYKLNRYFHEMGYLQPKIIFTAVLACVLGIRYGLNF